MINFMIRTERGLYSRFITYGHCDPDMPEVTLLPVCHVGEDRFYGELYWEKWTHDVVLIEGASSKPARIVSWLVKKMSALKRIRLTFQNSWTPKSTKILEEDADYPSWTRTDEQSPWEKTVAIGPLVGRGCIKRHVKFIRADLNEEQSERALRTVPFWAWGLLPIIAILALFASRAISRSQLLDGLEQELPGPKDIPDWRIFRALEHYVITLRDDFLALTLAQQIKSAKGRNKKIAVEFGAGHMRKLHNFLSNELGYNIKSSRDVLAIGAQIDQSVTSADGYGISLEKYKKIMGHVFEPKMSSIIEDIKKPTNRRIVPTSIKTNFVTKLATLNRWETSSSVEFVDNDWRERLPTTQTSHSSESPWAPSGPPGRVRLGIPLARPLPAYAHGLRYRTRLALLP